MMIIEVNLKSHKGQHLPITHWTLHSLGLVSLTINSKESQAFAFTSWLQSVALEFFMGKFEAFPSSFGLSIEMVSIIRAQQVLDELEATVFLRDKLHVNRLFGLMQQWCPLVLVWNERYRQENCIEESCFDYFEARVFDFLIEGRQLRLGGGVSKSTWVAMKGQASVRCINLETQSSTAA